jgi:hypothetical protein
VPEFAGHPAEAAHELAVGEDSGADSLRDREDHQVANLLWAVEPDRGQDARVRRIFQGYVEPGGGGDG